MFHYLVPMPIVMNVLVNGKTLTQLVKNQNIFPLGLTDENKLLKTTPRNTKNFDFELELSMKN